MSEPTVSAVERAQAVVWEFEEWAITNQHMGYPHRWKPYLTDLIARALDATPPPAEVEETRQPESLRPRREVGSSGESGDGN